jgi:hypothetical protein
MRLLAKEYRGYDTANCTTPYYWLLDSLLFLRREVIFFVCNALLQAHVEHAGPPLGDPPPL